MADAPKAVIFDLGNTLVGVDFDGIVERLTGRPSRGVRPEALVEHEILVRWCTGRLAPRDFHREVCRATGSPMDYDAFVRWWCDVFRPLPGAETLLREVAAVARVGLLSDTDPLHWEHERRAEPWLDLVPSPTLSFRIGLLKPDPGCYLAAARSVGLPPGACLFVDDLPRNVAGALAVGMQAVRFSGIDALRAELVGRGVLAARD